MGNTSQKPQTGTILVPTSPGQLLDRISILRIKAEKLRGKSKHAAVVGELDELTGLWQRYVNSSAAILELERELERVNLALWEVEDRLRLYEGRSDFGEEFITAARSVYTLNDRRFDLKRQVDGLLGCVATEEKLYRASENAS